MAVEQPRFGLPPSHRAPRWAWICAAVLHVPLVLLLVGYIRRATISRWHTVTVGLSARDTNTIQFMIRDRPSLHRPPPTAARVTAQSPAPVSQPANVATAEPGVAAPTAVVGADTGAVVRSNRIGAGFVNGALHPEPLPETPRVIAQQLTGKSGKQLIDSAVTAMVQGYLDAMAREAPPATLPSWTTKVGGKTVGVDSRWIYLGPLKVPTALLALLPINLQGNPTQMDLNRRLASMREDIYFAAQRSATLDEFKAAVKRMRAETEHDKEIRRNQRLPPDPEPYP